ncbi:MAG: hypothetical protein MI975_12455, partial [Cytophagales bacterium]|nr:hypothetical protein [Cytophagales bacterium]
MPTLFLGLLIGINLTLNYYVDKVVGTLIKEFVHEKSNGFYYVDFKEIAYILNNGRFYMSEFKFDVHPDHRAGFDSLDYKYIFSATIPSLHIDIIDFWSIFVSRKLRIIGIDISEPFIKIINLNKEKTPKKLSFEAGNLYEILSGHLKELKVNDFRISGAEFDYETYNGPDYDNFLIKELTFEVNNFQVNEDANKRKDKIFYTDDIFLEIKDQELLLKDSLHKVSFDKFYISTGTNEFGFENFKLTRRTDAGIKFKRHDHYEIDLPVLRLAGIDFLSAYNDNLLKIDSLNIEDPVVNIMKRTVKERRDSSSHNILDAAMIYHDFLEIDHFNLSDAHLIVTDETKPISKQYRVDHISAHVTKIEIDAGSNSQYRYGFNFDDADLVVKDYEVKLPDSLNTVKFDEFSVSSDPFEIKLKELSIQPSRTGDSAESTGLLYASIPYLVITEFDVAQAINSDTFLVDEIYIENPEINLVQSGEQKAKKTGRGPGGLFGIYERIQSMSDYFKLNNLNLVNGKFVIENPAADQELNLELNGVNVGLQNLAVDRLTNTEHDFYGTLGIDLSVNKSTIDMPFGTINFKYLGFESKDGKLMVDSMQIALDSSKIRQNIKVDLPELLLTGIDPNEVLFKNKISLDSLKFGEVSMYADLLSELPGNENSLKNTRPYAIPRVEIDHLVGLNYDIDLRKKGSRLFYADNINFNISKLIFDQTISDNLPNQFDYSEIHRMSIDNYDFYLRNQNHLLQSEKIHWNNSDSTFSMKGIRLKPFGEANNQYDIEIPGITMSGIDLKRVLKDSYYDGDDIIIKNPKIKLKLVKGRQENLTSLDLGFIPVLLQNRYLGARANTLKIDRAELSFHQQIENDSLIVEIDHFNLLVDNFAVDSTTKMVPERFLFANDVHLQGDYLSCFVQGKSDFYNVNHFDISTEEKDIFLNGIYYGSNTADFSFNKAKTKLSVENLNIMDFDFFDFTQNR